jgi:general stress protein 26
MEYTQQSQKLLELIKTIEVAMLVTEDGGQLRSRPMAGVQRAFDGDLWFFTRASSHKVRETADHQTVNLSYAHPGKENYVSVSGWATLVQDHSVIAQYWTESMRVWFPKGKNDPDIAMLKVTVDQAEYWDAPSSTMLQAYGYVKALLTGAPPHPGEHAKIAG